MWELVFLLSCIENQIEMCRRYIRLQLGDAAADSALVYEDEGFSGGTLERPQFKRMMSDARKMNFRAVVVYRLDRISRNIGDFAKLIEQLNGMDIDFISIKEQFDTSSAMGRAMMYISSVFSQLERETIAERIRDNMRELAKTGRWLGGVTPTGYASESVARVTIDGRTRKACRLKVIPEEMRIVRTIFDTFVESGSLTKTEAYLLQNRYATKNGRQFSRFAVKAILSNPVYLIADETAYAYLINKQVDLFSDKAAFDGVHGIMAYNRTHQLPGKAHKLKPMEEWIVSVGRHKGVVDGKTWVKVQTLLERNRSRSYRKPRSHSALLSGRLICGACGAFMRPKQSRRLNGKDEPVYSYLCSMKERSRGHICHMKNCGGNILDAEILGQVSSIREDGPEFIRQLEKSRRVLLENTGSSVGELTELEGNAAALEEEIGALVTTLGRASGDAAEEYILRRIGELHEKGEELKRRMAELKGAAACPTLSDREFEHLAQNLSVFKNTVEAMSIEQKREAVRVLFKEIIWDGQEAHAVLYGSEYAYEFSEKPTGKENIHICEAISEDADGGVGVEPSGEYSK